MMSVNLLLYFKFCTLFFAFGVPLACALDSIVVVDDLNRKIKLQKPAERIISLAPNITENVFAIGVGERIVGTVEFSDYPSQAKAIPRIGNHASISIESIVDLKPDLILAWKASISDEQIKQYESLGLAVYVDEIQSMEDIANSIRVYGRLLGVSDKAENTARSFEKKVQEIQGRASSNAPLRVFYQLWHSPMQTLNGDSLVGDVIERCGGVNIFADAPSVAPLVGLESVIHLNPELIVASAREEGSDVLSHWSKYSMIDAVANDNFTVIHPDLILRHSTRIIAGLEQMCRAIASSKVVPDN